MARRLSFHAFLNLKRQSALSWLCGDAGQREAGSVRRAAPPPAKKIDAGGELKAGSHSESRRSASGKINF
jgi:hypothetical protein